MQNSNNMSMQHMQQNSQTSKNAFLPGNIGISNPQQLQQQQMQHQQQQQQRMQYQQTPYNSINMSNKHSSQYLTQKSEDPMLSQVKIENDLMVTQATPISVSNDSQELPPQLEEPMKEAAVAGTQKTAEKMRKDEG